MQKSPHEIRLEQVKPFGKSGPYAIEKRKIMKTTEETQIPVGEIVTVRNWGTFGCWDTKNRWVSFYDSELVETIRNWDRK